MFVVFLLTGSPDAGEDRSCVCRAEPTDDGAKEGPWYSNGRRDGDDNDGDGGGGGGGGDDGSGGDDTNNSYDGRGDGMKPLK